MCNTIFTIVYSEKLGYVVICIFGDFQKSAPSDMFCAEMRQISGVV